MILWAVPAGTQRPARAATGYDRHMVDMAFARRGHLVLTMNTAAPPSTDDWNRYLIFCADLVAEYRNASMLPFSIVFTDGGAPNTEQRRSFVDVVGKTKFSSSIVTTSRLTQGVVTLLSWFTPGLRAFSPTNVDGILDHCGPGRAILNDVMALAAPLDEACHGIGVFARFQAAASAPVQRVSTAR